MANTLRGIAFLLVELENPLDKPSNGPSYILAYPKKGDFLVDDHWLFEIGGRGKGFNQIKDVPDTFVVNDGVEVGFGNKIPLWLFGFLY